MPLKNSTISIDDIHSGALSESAKPNENPPSITDLGSGISTRQPFPADSDVMPGVGGGPQWDSSKLPGDWSGK